MENIELPTAGGFISVPSEFKDNLIMGLTYLSAPRTAAVIDFLWDFQTIGGIDGI